MMKQTIMLGLCLIGAELLPVQAQIGGLAPKGDSVEKSANRAGDLGGAEDKVGPAARPSAAETEPEKDEGTGKKLPAAQAVEQDGTVMSMRDPFWPIGWEPPPEDTGPITRTPKSPIQWADAKKTIKVTALSKTARGDFVAIIQGLGVIENGDVIQIPYKRLMYGWTVIDITASGIKTKQLGVTGIKR